MKNGTYLALATTVISRRRPSHSNEAVQRKESGAVIGRRRASKCFAGSNDQSRWLPISGTEAAERYLDLSPSAQVAADVAAEEITSQRLRGLSKVLCPEKAPCQQRRGQTHSR
jgi:hypothetical protein